MNRKMVAIGIVLGDRTPKQLEQLERMIAEARKHPVKLGRR